MRRIVLFTALGTGLAIAGGVGLSMAHTVGLFAPAQADWLTTSRVVTQTPVAPVIDDVEPVAARAPVPVLPVPQMFEPANVRAPIPNVAPLMRPDRAAPVEMVRAPAPPARTTTPVITPRLSTQGTAPFQPAPSIPQAGPFQNAPVQNMDAIDDVWMLGVFR